jgi:hypothetical protein
MISILASAFAFFLSFAVGASLKWLYLHHARWAWAVGALGIAMTGVFILLSIQSPYQPGSYQYSYGTLDGLSMSIPSAVGFFAGYLLMK